jgi:four helix bundle protein
MKLQHPRSREAQIALRETPSTKTMKLQAPSSKLQGSSKSQAPTKARKNGARSPYSKAEMLAARVHEESNGNGASRHPFDLEERTASFGEAIIRFAKKMPRTPANDRLIGQLVGCGTSIGANYCEANERVSKKDFRNTIGRCVKEAKETKYFLRLIAAAEPQLAQQARGLYREAKELHLIFASMFRR